MFFFFFLILLQSSSIVCESLEPAQLLETKRYVWGLGRLGKSSVGHRSQIEMNFWRMSFCCLKPAIPHWCCPFLGWEITQHFLSQYFFMTILLWNCFTAQYLALRWYSSRLCEKEPPTWLIFLNKIKKYITDIHELQHGDAGACEVSRARRAGRVPGRARVRRALDLAHRQRQRLLQDHLQLQWVLHA